MKKCDISSAVWQLADTDSGGENKQEEGGGGIFFLF